MGLYASFDRVSFFVEFASFVALLFATAAYTSSVNPKERPMRLVSKRDTGNLLLLVVIMSFKSAVGVRFVAQPNTVMRTKEVVVVGLDTLGVGGGHASSKSFVVRLTK